MIDVKAELIDSIIEKAVCNINREQEDSFQLVSITKKITQVDPIHFFEIAKATGKNRIFWTSSDANFCIVGVGEAYEMSATTSRFESTKKQWNELLNNTIIYNPYQEEGTGLLAVGGMTFDPKREKTALWKMYKPIQFTVPEFLLTKNQDDYFFTMTVRIHKDDDPRKIVNYLKKTEQILLHGSTNIPPGAKVIAKQEIEPEKWLQTVRLAREEIRSNKAKKIVLARELRLKLNKGAEIAPILQSLLQTQPNSYIFAFEKGDNCFLGATPERLVKVEGSKLLSTCLAGTAPRGKTAIEDKEIAAALLADNKNLEEHGYVVKMIRAAMERYCTNIDIPEKPVVFPLKNLQHLYTPVSAQLKNNYTIFDIVKELHPTPALGGVPGEESLQFIREHELLDRGWYGAPIGWLDSNACGEFAVAIRSGLMQGDEASLFAGCGIMKDSDPKKEYEETNIKFMPMLSVLGG